MFDGRHAARCVLYVYYIHIPGCVLYIHTSDCILHACLFILLLCIQYVYV